jgi:uncharacterized protein YraI
LTRADGEDTIPDLPSYPSLAFRRPILTSHSLGRSLRATTRIFREQCLSSGVRSWVAIALFAFASLASAQTAITTRAVTVRAGPDGSFPPVTWLVGGTSLAVVGCLATWRWCDVGAGRDRGWISARYLAYTFNGREITIRDGGPQLGLPSIEFSIVPYWDEHYQGRPFFGRRLYWQNRMENRAPAPAWRPPRSGASSDGRPAP